MIIDLIIFIVLVVLIVLVARDVMIYNIRKLSILLKWKHNIVGQILGYATSTPELISAIVAGCTGLIDTSIYNVVTSNFVNLFLVIGMTIAFKKQKAILNKKFIFDYLMIVITLIVPVVLILTKLAETPYAVPGLLVIYAIYLRGAAYVEYFASEDEEIDLEEKSYKLGMKISRKRKIKVDNKKKIVKSIIMLIISIIALYLLGEALGAVLEKLGKVFKVSQIILGVIMGIITSIPECITFITSFRRHRRQKDYNNDKSAVEVVNNLAASNVANLTIIQTVAILTYMIFLR